MEVTFQIEQTFNIKKLQVSAGVRYWEDAKINGVCDENGDLIPCRNGDCFEPLICIESGIILNWENGKEASLHYKVCDAGEYTLVDDKGDCIKTIEGYVPSMMCPEGDGFGDYIIMEINKEGQISNWKPSFEEFAED